MARVPPVCWPDGLPQLPTSPLADLPAQVPNPIRLWWPAERLAVQRRGRRRTGFSMLHQCPGGVPVRCNGLFDNGTARQGFPDLSQRVAGGSKATAFCEQAVVVFEPESLRLHSFRPGFRRLPPLHSSSDQIRPTANRPRKKYPACRTPCRSAARAPHERFVDVTPISLRRLRPLQRLVRRQDNQFPQFPRRSRPVLRNRPVRDVPFPGTNFPTVPYAGELAIAGSSGVFQFCGSSSSRRALG